MNKKLKIKIGKETFNTVIFIWYFTFTSNSTTLYELFPSLNDIFPSYFNVVILVVLLLIYSFRNIRKVNKSAMLIIVGLPSILLLNWFLRGAREYVAQILFSPTFLLTILMMFFIATDKKHDARWRQLRCIGYFTTIVFLLAEQSGLFVSSESVNYMTFGYGLALYWMIFFHSMLKEKKLLSGFFCVLAGINLLIYGNRGALAIVLIYVVYELVQGGRANKLAKILLMIVGVLSLLNYQMILGFLYDRYGDVSRTLSLLYKREMVTSVARVAGYQESIELIKARPFFGWGVGADREYLSIATAHNFMLELMIDYGIIIGGVLIALILFIGIYVLMKVRSDWKEIFVVFYTFSLTQLMFSSSLYDNAFFWFWLMVFLSNNKNKLEDKGR